MKERGQGLRVKVTKRDLCRAVAKNLEITLDAAAAVVDSFLAALRDALRAGLRVEIRGLGGFRPRPWAGRKVRPPGAAKALKVSDSATISFKPGRALRGMR